MVRRRELEQLAAAKLRSGGGSKRAYDSDEEVEEDAGTWEHQLRKAEMDATRGITLLLPPIILHNSSSS